ncbi:MAG: FKBP-type peptidyl-prolyl cis-trans isomerase [Alphaproteobacteria bacterium]|nr:FKBP-type peptidyl-prolyl cis-trans isomerase [Alphaproteobacteria bacterium]
MRIAPFALLTFCALASPAMAEAPTPAAIAAFLAANAKAPGVVVRPDGLQYSILHSGVGRRAMPSDYARIAYTGRLIDGTTVDGTSPGLPVTLAISSGIAGLSEALSMMHEGDRWRLVVPANLAFGTKGAGEVPPGQALVIDVTLIAAETPARARAEAGSNPLSFAGNSQQQNLLFTFRP